MSLESNWRWFGPEDPISLNEIRQTDVSGIVTALHQIPVGEIWKSLDVRKRKELVNSKGFHWHTVESLPVHENIKKRSGGYLQLIDFYKQSLKNLADNGIENVIYNFMPVLDWSRTDLKVTFYDTSITTRFGSDLFAVFDLFILQRKDAEENYSKERFQKIYNLYKSLNEKQKSNLTKTILLGLPGTLETYSLDEFKKVIAPYQDISEEELLGNLIEFLREIIPVAEEYQVNLAIHPDDPPWSLLGLPRVVGNAENIRKILNAVSSQYNGLAFCVGSLGVSVKNDMVAIVKEFAEKIHFSHLRNVTRNEQGDFMEDHPLGGDIDLPGIVKILLEEQKRRLEVGRTDIRMPFRPDHGHLMSPELNKTGIYPGYSLMGRLRALSEIRGLVAAIEKFAI